METSRFFVANLPQNVREKDLKQLFQDYGEVAKVEIKTKENLVDPSAVKTIAFVTLNIGNDYAAYCANELSWQKLNGYKLNVTIAKESFLERLKREREEAEAVKKGPSADQIQESTSELLTQPTQNKKKKFDENDDSLDIESIAPELLITKKKAANSIYNGKIVIQTYDSRPIHVIENKKVKKQLDEKASTAEQKRKESLKKLKNQYDQQKNAIQKALTGTDGSLAKKIKFSDDEEAEEVDSQSKKGKEKSKTNIFGSDDENDENDTNFKPILFSKKGEKLAQMQSKQSLDPRFKIDSKFVEDDDDDDNDGGGENDVSKKTKDVEENDERNWQIGILEQVVGHKIDSTTSQNKKANKKKMLRYDPSKDDHQKFERKKKSEELSTENMQEESETATNKPVEVSKDVFYVVEDTLADSFKSRPEGFSLLNMFGNNANIEEREDQLKQVSNEKILINKINNEVLNPFKYDSSSDSEQEDTKESKKELSKENGGQKEKTSTSGRNKFGKVKLTTESFFIPKNDPRLKEGATFFRFTKNQETEENYDAVRDRLKLLIKTKIAKTKKNLVNGGKYLKKAKRNKRY